MADRQPRLILVSGAPASGKSTLASHLAANLSLPLLGKDLIKETLFEALGTPDRETSGRLSFASVKVLYAVLHRLIDAGVGVVVDCNFQRGRSENALRPLAAKSDAILIHCWTRYDEMAHRYERRVVLRERHPGHHDGSFRDNLLGSFESGVYDPIDLDVPLLKVDTTDGYEPGLEEIITFAEVGTLNRPTAQREEIRRSD